MMQRNKREEGQAGAHVCKWRICAREHMGTLLKTRALGDLGEKVMSGERPEEDEKAINEDTQGKNIPGR